jgi:hypothetical protein
MRHCIAVAIALLLFVSRDANAQHRVESPWLAAELGSQRALVPYEPAAATARPGLAGATVGATAGTVLSLPLFLIMTLGTTNAQWEGDVSDLTALIPVVVGTVAGASFGASLDGGEPATGSTLVGALAGAAVGVYAMRTRREPFGWSGMLVLTVPPTVGAVVGNRLGQRGR